jgi:hypothetical protein
MRVKGGCTRARVCVCVCVCVCARVRTRAHWGAWGKMSVLSGEEEGIKRAPEGHHAGAQQRDTPGPSHRAGRAAARRTPRLPLRALRRPFCPEPPSSP